MPFSYPFAESFLKGRKLGILFLPSSPYLALVQEKSYSPSAVSEWQGLLLGLLFLVNFLGNQG